VRIYAIYLSFEALNTAYLLALSVVTTLLDLVTYDCNMSSFTEYVIHTALSSSKCNVCM